MTSSSMRSSSRMGVISPPPSDTSFETNEDVALGISTLKMPSLTADDDSDEEEQDTSLAREIRESTMSTVSLDMQERVDALQKVNADLGKKLIEAERTLQIRLSDHESELDDLHQRLETAKNELSATKREEKELRAKEVRIFTVSRILERNMLNAFSLAHQFYSNRSLGI